MLRYCVISLVSLIILLFGNKNMSSQSTVELRWLEPLWDHENLFETAVVRASEGFY